MNYKKITDLPVVNMITTDEMAVISSKGVTNRINAKEFIYHDKEEALKKVNEIFDEEYSCLIIKAKM